MEKTNIEIDPLAIERTSSNEYILYRLTSIRYAMLPLISAVSSCRKLSKLLYLLCVGKKKNEKPKVSSENLRNSIHKIVITFQNPYAKCLL